LDGRFNLGAGWRTLLTKSNDRMIAGFPPFPQRGLQSFSIGTDDVNGFVFTLGLGRRLRPVVPPPPCEPPTVALEANKNVVLDGEIVSLTARASDPDNDPLVYIWSTTGGQIVGSGAQVQLNTAGVNSRVGAPPVQVVVTVTVDDQRCGTDSSNVTITVNAPQPPPNQPPTIRSIQCNQVVGAPQVPGQITDGEIVRVTAVANDPDGDTLTYQWRTTAGQLRGTGAEVTLDTTGVTAGPGAPPVSVTVTLSIADGRGGSASNTCTLTVHALPKPEISPVKPDLEFRRGSARVDNVHKAILDDVALRMQQEPEALLVIDGHVDRGEPRRLAQQRAENTKLYLVREKRIDPDRIIIRNFGSDRPHPSGQRARNRRIELYVVPPGAEMPR
jgi:outer membrane protein OmpA-like peptidoglycan-associated protein